MEGSRKGRQILAVDDDPFLLEMIQDVLEREGMMVHPALSGPQALALLEREKIDLVLLDIVMPGMDGYELLRRIREKEPSQAIPVIFLSARSSSQDRVQGLELGAEDYLSKPFSPAELAVKVRLWLRIKETEQALRERNRELSGLLQSSALLTSSLNLEETLERIIEVAQGLLPSTCANLMLLNERGELIIEAQANFPEEWWLDLQSRPLKLGESLSGWVAQNRKPLYLADPLSHPEFAYRSAPFARKYGIASYLGLPLLVGERLIGVLNFNGLGDRGFSEEQIGLISAFAQHAAVAIDNVRAYQKVRQAESYLDNLIANSQDAIISLDREGIIRLWNRGAERIYGYSAEEVIGRSIELILFEEEREEARGRLKRILEGEGAEVFSSRQRRRGGQSIYILATWSPLPEVEGEVRSVSLIHKDISELVRMEELIRESRNKLRAVIDGITDFLYVVDKDLRLSHINASYASFLQRSPQSLVGLTCYQVLRGRSQPCSDCLVPEVLAQKRGAGQEREELGPHGEKKIWQVSAFPVSPEQEEAGLVIHWLKDITDKKWMEHQVVQREKLASLGQLAAGVAHEINNPLASLSLYSELLRRSSRLDEEAERYLQAMEENVERIARIVRNLLDFSRPASGSLRPVRVEEVISGSLGILKGHSLFRDIRIEREIEENLPPVRGNHRQLEQVLVNLMLNAAQSMPEGGCIRIRAKKGPGPFLEVAVQDTGSGIAPELLPRIFDPFFTTKPAGEGTGLGLSVVRRIIENHRGVISVESELGKGSLFTFTLPTQVEEEDVGEAVGAMEEGAG